MNKTFTETCAQSFLEALSFLEEKVREIGFYFKIIKMAANTMVNMP